MNSILGNSLRLARKLNSIACHDEKNFGRNWTIFPNKEYANDLIYNYLIRDEPCMIARFGSNELMCLTNYLAVKQPEKFKSYSGYIRSETPAWWWNKSALELLKTGAGFFPVDISNIERFCELMLSDVASVDILGSWRKEEFFLRKQLMNVKRVMLEDLEPFFSSNPWTTALENRKVLVVHPFTETIEKQYLLREKLFNNNLLPKFQLSTVKAIQSSAGEKTEFANWFEALDFMKAQIASKDFDICILGCGAYGFPLAAFVKKLGKKAIHLGGVTQLLFGIKGKRWEEYVVYPYSNLYNKYWVRPSEIEKPKNAILVEGACYW